MKMPGNPLSAKPSARAKSAARSGSIVRQSMALDRALMNGAAVPFL
jgi:hypothetical protein